MVFYSDFCQDNPLVGQRRREYAGAPVDPDLNKYDLNHVCTTHSKMSVEEWKRAYSTAWRRYYTPEQAETITRRVAATRANASNARFVISWFMGSINIEHIHPLESGRVRPKFRCDRRPGFPDRAGLVVLPEICR